MFVHEIYAVAFVEATEHKAVDSYLEFKEAVSVLLSMPKLCDALLFDAKRLQVFEDAFEVLSAEVSSFLKIVIEDGFIESLKEIELSIREQLVKKRLWNVCIIESGGSMSESLESKLLELINNKTKNKVEIEKRENPKLKHGVRLILNDEIIDMSIQGRLNRLMSEVM